MITVIQGIFKSWFVLKDMAYAISTVHKLQLDDVSLFE